MERLWGVVSWSPMALAPAVLSVGAQTYFDRPQFRGLLSRVVFIAHDTWALIFWGRNILSETMPLPGTVDFIDTPTTPSSVYSCMLRCALSVGAILPMSTIHRKISYYFGSYCVLCSPEAH